MEAGQLGAAATKASLAAARASPDPLPPPPLELMVYGPRLWLTNCDGPGAQPARNAAHDEFDSLHLLWHNTGLGTQRALLWNVSTIAGSGAASPFREGAAATFFSPWGVSLSTDNARLLVADTLNRRVRQVSLLSFEASSLGWAMAGSPRISVPATAPYVYSIPPGCVNASAVLFGGGGGGGWMGTGGTGAGVFISFPVLGLSTFSVWVGSGGPGGATSGCGGSGGSASSVAANGTVLVIAGGGGGGATVGNSFTPCAGGAAGLPSPGASVWCGAYRGGWGGTNSSGGSNGPCLGGTTYAGCRGTPGAGPCTSGAAACSFMGGFGEWWPANNFNRQGVGYALGGKGGCDNSGASVCGGGGGGGGYYGGGGGSQPTGAGSFSAPGGGASSFSATSFQGSALSASFFPGASGGARYASGADGNVTLECFNGAAAPIGNLSGRGFPSGALSLSAGTPAAVAASAAGALIVSDTQNSILRLLLSNGTVALLAGNNSAGFANGVGTQASFSAPAGLAFFPNGDVAVADSGNHRIRRVSLAGAVLTFAGSGSNASLVNGAAAVATFNNPLGVAVDGSGNVYVSDTGNNCVRLISLGGVRTFAGSTVQGFADGPGPSAAFFQPRQLAIGVDGMLFVADSANNRIRAVSPLGVVTTIAGGAAGGFFDGYGALSRLQSPGGVALDPSGNLFVGDTQNNRIRKLTCVPCPASFYCSTGVPVLCPAGSACPLSSTDPTPCPAGTFSAAGATACTPCTGGAFNTRPGSASCQQCTAGYYCPPGGCAAAPFGVPCGAGNYCPAGSAAPIPCPAFGTVDAAKGPSNGPAFDVDTAACLNHCFFGGDGQKSAC